MKGNLLIISGPSGSGKGYIASKLIENYNNFSLSISATTRNIRPGEVDGINYFYKTRNEFEEMIKNGELLEYAEFVGNYYGTPKQFVLDKINIGQNVLLEIEMQGALKVKEIFPDALLIFIAIPSLDELKFRLKNRGRESDEDIKKRIKQAKVDISYADKYDYVVMNDDINKVMNDFEQIINGNFSKEESNKNLQILKNIAEEIN